MIVFEYDMFIYPIWMLDMCVALQDLIFGGQESLDAKIRGSWEAFHVKHFVRVYTYNLKYTTNQSSFQHDKSILNRSLLSSVWGWAGWGGLGADPSALQLFQRRSARFRRLDLHEFVTQIQAFRRTNQVTIKDSPFGVLRSFTSLITTGSYDWGVFFGRWVSVE